MKKYPDDETMEDDDSYLDINGQDDGLPMLCRCGQLFEAHEGQVSFETGKLICSPCRKKEIEEGKQEIRKEIALLEVKYRRLKVEISLIMSHMEKLTMLLA